MVTRTQTPNVDVEVDDIETPLTYAQRFGFKENELNQVIAQNIKVGKEYKDKGKPSTTIVATARLQEHDIHGNVVRKGKYAVETYVSIKFKVKCWDGEKAQKEYENTLKSFYALEGLTYLEITFSGYEEAPKFDEESGKVYETIWVTALDVRSIKPIVDKVAELEGKVAMLEAMVEQLSGSPVSLPTSDTADDYYV